VDTANTLRSSVADLMPLARDDLARMVALRSVYDPRATPPEDCARMVDLTVELLAGVGATDAAPHVTSDGSSTVIGHIPAPAGAPTVLLYFHHDVQPAPDHGWDSPPWELTERNGRWYGRGASDCKGNLAVHLTALRALGPDLPVGVTLVGEGSEELGDGGLEEFVPANAGLLQSDVILVCDTGNRVLGGPTLTTTLRGVVEVTVRVRALASSVHSGKFGGAAPDALAALVHMLATLRDERGNTTVRGLDASQTWTASAYDVDAFRQHATVLDGVDLLGDGVADMVWARPALTILGIDCPSVEGSAAVLQPEARAMLSLRVPPGMDATVAQDALVAHLTAVAPWRVAVDFEPGFRGEAFAAPLGGPAFTAMSDALRASYGRDVELQGDGGSIPLCTVLQQTFPAAEIMLLGVEEPQCLIHAANESVDPSEIEHLAFAEALFLRELAARFERG
jgi:acetylornithine deacetylase/succinyl-diaminopimelate desuccinylase-like protein